MRAERDGSHIGLIALRLALTALQAAAMVGLAAVFGVARFSEIAVLWGATALAGAAMSGGGAVILLRHLCDGRGLRGQALLKVLLLWPLGLCGLLLPALLWVEASVLLPAMAAGFAFNLLQNAASILRATGSLGLSMAVRDGVPVLAIVGAAFAGEMAMAFAAAMGAAGLLALRIGVPGLARRGLLSPAGGEAAPDAAQWANGFAGMAVAQIDILLASLLLPPSAAGLYALLRRLANLATLPASAAVWVIASDVATAGRLGDAEMLAQSRRRFQRVTVRPTVALACAILPVGLAVALALPAEETLSVTGLSLLCLLLLAGVQNLTARDIAVATLTGVARRAVLGRLVIVATVALAAPFATAVLGFSGMALAALLGGVSGAVFFGGIEARGWRGAGSGPRALRSGEVR